MGCISPKQLSVLLASFALSTSLVLSSEFCLAADAEQTTVSKTSSATPPKTSERARFDAPVSKSRNGMRKLLDTGSFFKKDLDARSVFNSDQFKGDIVNLDEPNPADWKAPEAATDNAHTQTPATQTATADKPKADAPASDGLTYRRDDPTSDPILPPEQTPAVRVEGDAPSPVRGMIKARREGNTELAEQYADQFVRYQQNFFFEIREIVSLIGDAMIREKAIEEDKWIGAEQNIDIEMARSRKENGELLKPTHDVAMKRITPDENNKVEIFYFFSVNCSWCRYMAPDIERLYQATKNDPNVTFHAVSIGEVPLDWMNEYRSYSGMTMPLADGTEFAKKMKIGFVPALIAIAPTKNQAYLKTGQQSFTNMYEFVRTVQGLPPSLTPEVQQLVKTPIGQVELAKASKDPERMLEMQKVAAKQREEKKDKLDRF